MLKENNIKNGIITANDNVIMEHIIKFNHFNKIDKINRGSEKKIEILTSWKDEYNIEWDEIAYIGDDISDLECIQKVGFSACPNDAVKVIKDNCDFISQYNGGNGAVREFIEYILSNKI